MVLAHREFETWFLPCLHLMAGRELEGPKEVKRPGLLGSTPAFTRDFESIRGVKEWLGKYFAGNKRYKPSLDQLPLTRLIDLDVLRRAAVPSFGTLERALAFLAHSKRADVYPPPQQRLVPRPSHLRKKH